MTYDTKAQSDVYRLSQIFSSGQRTHHYWKCSFDTKTIDFMDSIGEENEGLFFSSMNY